LKEALAGAAPSAPVAADEISLPPILILLI
jgi:hypothetical protein